MTCSQIARQFRSRPSWFIGALLVAAAGAIIWMLWPVQASAQGHNPPPNHGECLEPYPMPPELLNIDLMKQTDEQAAAKSAGCITCHTGIGDPHGKPTVRLGCTDCHGGDPTSTDINQAHVASRFPDTWRTSGNPVRSYTVLNHERPEFIRFVNPGDLRIAHISCGTSNCHPREVLQNRMSMMTHGCMLWGAALYNNGAVPHKRARYGEAYSMHGVPLRLQTVPPPTKEEIEKHGVLPYLDPLPRFEISQPGNILRIFERGGRFRPEIGIPERTEEPGRPRTRLSLRGLGTENRTDPVFVGLQKTRLLDPTLNFLGTNDHPGDFRSSGCTACHMIYANDRSRVHSGPYAQYGHLGRSFSPDPSIPRDQPGHPIEHKLTTAIPSSQCIVCHTHPGTTVMNSYLGYLWWDLESDGELMYPAQQKYPTAQEYVGIAMNSLEESSMHGNWSDPRFLERVYDLNSQTRFTHFADFHAHGWIYRAVWKHDRKGNWLDHNCRVIDLIDNSKITAATRNQHLPPRERRQEDGVPQHQMDIHLERGMHCADCHFVQDCHGNTRIQAEVRAAVEIHCVDCHGTVTQRANLRTSGPASYTSSPDGKGRDLAALRTPWGERRFERQGNKLIQRSVVEKDLWWEIVEVIDTLDPESEHYNEKSRFAKTLRWDASSNQVVWGDIPPEGDKACAHAISNMNCIACHTSWNPSCFGCHLPQRANKKMPYLHWEGDVTRNYTSYNWQTLRDDVFMLGRDGDVTGNRINPCRSSCAIHVTSYNNNRETIYVQQQTISADGLSGIAFSSNVPHTVRGGPPRIIAPGQPNHGRAQSADAYLPGRNDTKQCTDCHLSKNDDNNAIMAQLFMQGTNFVNWIGKYCWVAAGEHGIWAPIVTETEEPQSVIGSYQHLLAYPDYYHKHVKNGRMLQHAHEHPGKDVSDAIKHPFRKVEILSLQNRGEYLYAACGEGGLRVFDIAFIDNKAFAERITTAPVSPIGQKFYVPTKYATAVASPATTAPDPTRVQNPLNKEPAVSLLYAFLYVTDKHEGLILVGAGTLLDGNPTNNFLKRQLTFNPDGILCGARAITIVGHYAWICADAGLVIVSLANPLEPKVVKVIGEPFLKHPVASAVQFRYGFVCDKEGLKVFDVTDLENPRAVAQLEVEHCHNLYIARTYCYIAAGPHGLVIVDVENPEKPKIDQVFTADGCINDLHDVKLGATYASEFAYLADGKNGMRVVQLTSPEMATLHGFSPRPHPVLIATFKIPHGGHALAIAEGVDRDRAIDESGNQLSVFGRIGARPLNLQEQKKMYLRNGEVWKVSDDPRDYGPPRPWRTPLPK